MTTSATRTLQFALICAMAACAATDTSEVLLDSEAPADALVLASPKANYTQFPSGAVDLTKYTSAGPAEVASMKAFLATPGVSSIEPAKNLVRALRASDSRYASVSSDGLDALAGYSGFHFTPINKALRGAAKDPALRPLLTPVEGYIKLATSVLPAFPTSSAILWRGLGLANCDEACRRAFVATYPVGKTVYEPSFFSTSESKITACTYLLQNTPILYEIEPTQQGRKIKAISQYPAEEEVLFAPGTKFAVTRVEANVTTACKRPNPFGESAPISLTLIHMRAVP